MSPIPMNGILSLEGVSVRLPPGADRSHAMRDISLSVAAGEILCVVGESGSGKSMTANAIMRLLPPGVALDGGRILFEGRDLASLDEWDMRRVRGAGVAMIFQEPMTALNPLMRIGDQIGETLSIHTDMDAKARRAKVLSLLAEVHIPNPQAAADAYPHELSGGQRQRAMIAGALALDPRLLIADEPTTALDVTTQAQILKLIRDLQRRKGTGVLFITHDFGVVAEIADRVAVMRQGEVVETGPTEEILTRPTHPYTQQLLAAVPSLRAPPPRPISDETVLSIENLAKTYRNRSLFGRARRVTHALQGVSMALPRGGTIGVVGESGSGKSTLARCLMRLIEPDGGAIRLDREDLVPLSGRALHEQRRRIQIVFQDPFASLNPRRRAGELVAQGPMVYGASRADAMKRAADLFALVGLDPSAMTRYPHEFSGGQRQRIGLARALALEPDVLIADEPVSALDVSVQAQVLALLADLRLRLGLSILFITHDLRVAAQICDLIVVMKDGVVVEAGPTGRLFEHPQHPYTKALLDAVPGAARERGAAPPI